MNILFFCLRRPCLLSTCLMLSLFSCTEREDMPENAEPPAEIIYQLPVVVHVIHLGEPIGTGTNLSEERIQGQIRTLNEDFRRKAGTRGFNSHPDGADSRIEFVLAKSTPGGEPTNGIVRVNSTLIEKPTTSHSTFDQMAFYSYWNPEWYINIWTQPTPESSQDIYLGQATGPQTDLPGAELLLIGEPIQAEGIIINWIHFGESNINSDYHLGRTLTHEVGHYLGLLHTWGGKDCAKNDYCDDTPAVNSPVTSCPISPIMGCAGEPIMYENYMNWSPDACMNIFTKNQVSRMHYVLTNSPRRTTLLSSPGLQFPE